MQTIGWCYNYSLPTIPTKEEKKGEKEMMMTWITGLLTGFGIGGILGSLLTKMKCDEDSRMKKYKDMDKQSKLYGR